MIRSQFTADQLRGRLDCFSHFNRNDLLCLRHCALNIRCALAKKEWFEQEINEDFMLSMTPLDGDYGMGEG